MNEYQIFLISGLVIVVLLSFVLPALFQNRHARISRYFRQNPAVRFQLVKGLSQNASAIPGDLSALEMVAVLTLVCLKETVSASHAAAQRFSTTGWEGKFNDEFFDRLDSTARAFSAKRWHRDAIDLLRLGQRLAQSNANPHWERKFTESVERLQYQQVQSGLPHRQR